MPLANQEFHVLSLTLYRGAAVLASTRSGSRWVSSTFGLGMSAALLVVAAAVDDGLDNIAPYADRPVRECYRGELALPHKGHGSPARVAESNVDLTWF